VVLKLYVTCVSVYDYDLPRISMDRTQHVTSLSQCKILMLVSLLLLLLILISQTNPHKWYLPHVTKTFKQTETDALTAMVSHTAAFDSAVRFVRDIAEAVRYLHASRIVHLDIKPQNILVVPRDQSSGGASPIARNEPSEGTRPKSPILRPNSAGPSTSGTDPRHQRDAAVLGFGEMWMPKISDMGLGKHVGDNTSSFMLSPASVMGLARDCGDARGELF
jgi:serine/threonine protein kinase